MISAEDSIFTVYSNNSYVLPTYGPTLLLHEETCITVMVLQWVFMLFMHRYIYVDLNMLTLTAVKLFLCKVKGNKYPTLQERKTKNKIKNKQNSGN
jgi:hypothetical protein